jgi:hypothetical protein
MTIEKITYFLTYDGGFHRNCLEEFYIAVFTYKSYERLIKGVIYIYQNVALVMSQKILK